MNSFGHRDLSTIDAELRGAKEAASRAQSVVDKLQREKNEAETVSEAELQLRAAVKELQDVLTKPNGLIIKGVSIERRAYDRHTTMEIKFWADGVPFKLERTGPYTLKRG